jgi:hypothetical protein
MVNRLRHDTAEFVQQNAQHALTVLQLNSLKFRTRLLQEVANGI